MKLSLLVTGASGYIGRRLVAVCRDRDDLECVDVSRSAGFDLAAKGWTARLPKQRIDVVVHLAQSRRHREFPDGAADLFAVNVASTMELLEWARCHEVRRFVLASSGTVYAKVDSGCLGEESSCQANSMYAATKLCSEYLSEQYRGFLEIVIARLFTVYGPGRTDMLMADMISRVRDGQEITLASGTGPAFTPLFIDDCVEALVSMASTPLPSPLEIVNLAGDEVLSLRDIVGRIGEKLGRAPVTRSTDETPRSFCGSNGKMKRYSRPRVNLSVGLDRTLGISGV